MNVKQKHPDRPIIVHTQCREDVIKLADYAGSTSQIIEYVKNLKDKKVIQFHAPQSLDPINFY